MMHHMNSEEISMFWEYERRRYRRDQKPLIFKEVFQDLVHPRLQTNRDDWDNGSDDWFYIDFDRPDHQWEEWRVGRSVLEEKKTETEKTAHESWQNCQAACLEHEQCFQYFWHNQVCAFHSSFRLGWPRKASEDETLRHISGWNLEKIDRWVEENGDCGDRVDWPDLVRIAIERETQPEVPTLPEGIEKNVPTLGESAEERVPTIPESAEESVQTPTDNNDGDEREREKEGSKEQAFDIAI